VVGFGLNNICKTNSAMTLTIHPPNSVIAVQSTADDDAPSIAGSIKYELLGPRACRVTWTCDMCQLNVNSLPSFTLASTAPSWANLYGFNFSTPVLATSAGQPYRVGSTSVPHATVSQLIFPTINPVVDRTAFRASKATQQVRVCGHVFESVCLGTFPRKFSFPASLVHVFESVYLTMHWSDCTDNPENNGSADRQNNGFVDRPRRYYIYLLIAHAHALGAHIFQPPNVLERTPR
jgi:hypothetical protein